MQSYTKKGKYDFTFDDAQLTAESRMAIKNIIDQSAASDEQVAHIKTKLDSQSGDFIDSLNEFIFNYTSINQLSLNDFYTYSAEHIIKFVNFVEDQYENVPYTLYYRVRWIDEDMA